MTYDINVFCMECKKTITNSGGSVYKKVLIEALESISKENVDKLLGRITQKTVEAKIKCFKEEAMQYYSTKEIIELRKCKTNQHELVWEKV